ncbi:MAG: site-specific DNA-methyltransferase [Phycisphaerae bacterium]|nr:site-specific DNA-methyltransferase [Phycisphaerae bacterium]
MERESLLFENGTNGVATAHRTGATTTATLLGGNAVDLLRTFPSDHFGACVTSPPYWGLRDYGIEGQIGAEMDLDAYLSKLTDVFEEVRRVLKPDGTFWLNIGDSFTSGGRTWRQTDRKNAARGMSYRAPTPPGLKPKDLIGVPWRLAFALQAKGWYLRSDIIWHKPNGLPESVKDRPSRVHEYVFLFSKSERYFYDHEAVREQTRDKSAMRSLRSVWGINTEAYPEAHFATFPTALVDPCLRAGSREGDVVLDPFCGAGTTGVVAAKLQRSFVGIELNPDYLELAKKRLSGAGVKVRRRSAR